MVKYPEIISHSDTENIIGLMQIIKDAISTPCEPRTVQMDGIGRRYCLPYCTEWMATPLMNMVVI